MASSKEDSTTAAAAEQLGSMSLNRSAERNDENTKPIATSGTPTKMCSACEKKSDALKKCRNCKCVWYCDKECQNKHWKDHRKECKLIKKELDKRGGKLDFGTEKDLGPLPELPPKEECPICMHVLQPSKQLSFYALCCGKSICCGCSLQHQIKSKEQAVSLTCAFCRTAPPQSDEEIMVLRSKRIELKDPTALCNMAVDYGLGNRGLSVDEAKCIALLSESASLGYPPAQFQLGNYYGTGAMGLERSTKEGLKYYEKAAEGGHLVARHNVGITAAINGDLIAAMRHWQLSASAGMRRSMNNLIVFFQDGFLRHGDLAESLQAIYCSRAEMRSEGRDQYITHLKRIGKYDEGFEY